MKATPTGTAVRASPVLWIRSASSARLLVATKMTACMSAAAPRAPSETPTARSPARERLIEA